MSLVPGTRLGPHEIIAAVGAGGMGEVFKARDTRLDRTVAIKILLPQLALDHESRERFEREARHISALNHPNVCTLYNVGRDGDIDYLVMEFVAGQSLDERIARGALPLNEVIAMRCR